MRITSIGRMPPVLPGRLHERCARGIGTRERRAQRIFSRLRSGARRRRRLPPSATSPVGLRRKGVADETQEGENPTARRRPPRPSLRMNVPPLSRLFKWPLQGSKGCARLRRGAIPVAAPDPLVSSREGSPPSPSPEQMKQRPFGQPGRTSYPAVIGCDEVGRGALCGPVVVSAVWFDPACFDDLALLDDSKRLTARTRERLDRTIRACATVTVVAVAAPLIDRRGIRRATLEAMTRAIQELGVDAPVRVDGLDVPPGSRARRASAGAGGPPRPADRSRVHRRQSHAGPHPPEPRPPLPRLRVGSEHGVRDRGAPRRAPATRAHARTTVAPSPPRRRFRHAWGSDRRPCPPAGWRNLAAVADTRAAPASLNAGAASGCRELESARSASPGCGPPCHGGSGGSRAWR